MSLVGRPVLIRAGSNLHKVGIVDRMEYGMYVVEIGGREFAYEPEEVEPLFNLKEIAAVHVQELDDEGDPFGTTHLEKLVKPFGLTSDDLAGYVADFVVDAAARIRGIGDAQYSNQTFQKFEGKALMEVFNDADEELLDLMNYLVMLRIRIIRLANAIFEADDCVTEEEDSE
jgi:GNAT superfamily N-acetyltransferase